MPKLRLVRTRIARELLLAVGAPSLAVSLAGVYWLRSETRDVAPGLWGAVLAFLLVLAFAVTGLHLLAVRLLVEQPLARIVLALRRAEQGEYLLRMPVDSEDEVGQLARSFNTALAAITDLHARRLDDAESMASMQRELALKAELEAQHRLLDDAHRRLEGRVRELTLLADLARTLNATLDLDRLLHFVTERVGRTLGYDAFALLLFDEAAGDLVVGSAYGIDPSALGERVALGSGVAGSAALRREVLLVRDTRQDSRFPAHRWTGGRHGAVLAVPLLHQGTCVGVLDFFRPTPDGFSAEEIELLQAVASQAAMAIANARLYQRTLALSRADPRGVAGDRRVRAGG